MRRANLGAAVVSAAWLAAAGCASQPDARYVYQDGEFGVIGLPLNTTYGKKNYLRQAEELMNRHFPQGYEIVRAEEVVEGQRVLDTGKKTEFASEPTVSALNQMIKLGKVDRSLSLQQKDEIPILESRIIYKRRSPGTAAGANGFAALASTIPKYYIDPNEMSRCKAQQLLAEAKDLPGGVKASDLAAKKAAHDPGKGDDSALKKAAHESAK